MASKKKLTTAHGNPIADNQNSLTAGKKTEMLARFSTVAG